MSQRSEQFSCECGKQFSNRGDLDKHRQTCPAAQGSGSQSSGGGQVHGAGGGSGSPNR